MDIINTHEAKTHFSKLLRRVKAGEEIIIGRHGEPAAKLVPYTPNKPKRKLGTLAHTYYEAPDAWDEDPEIIALFEGDDDETFD